MEKASNQGFRLYDTSKLTQSKYPVLESFMWSVLRTTKKRPVGVEQIKKELTPERCIFHLHQARVSSLNSWYLTSI